MSSGTSRVPPDRACHRALWQPPFVIGPRRGNLWVILRASARSTEEPVKLPTGGIKGALERLFRFQGVDEGSTLIIDAVVENLLDAFPSQRGIFVDIADDLPA